MVKIDPHPDECPRCGNGMEPRVLPTSEVLVRSRQEEIQIAYQCTYRSCAELFIGIYRRKVLEQGLSEGFLFERSEPRSVKPSKHSKRIEAISAAYYEIYDQGRAAEVLDLKEIAGPAYRTALEFLVKDWLLKERNETLTDASKTDDEKRRAEAEIGKIKSADLRSCIKEFIAPHDDDIRTVVDATAVIGNDEVLYERRLGPQDLEQIKTLLETTVLWIERKEITREAQRR